MVYLKAVLVPTLFALFLKSIVAKNVYYNFESHYFTGAPDGVSVPHILGVNGQFPGPTIEATEGDVLYINLKNNINRKDNLTTLHWHGLFQNGTPFEDGPSMVTQCPIPYGKTQLYIIPLKQHGTYWWHSHSSYQYTEGNWGALIVHAKKEVYTYDRELVITLSDWSHLSGQVNINWFLSSASGGSEPIPYSILLNGRGSYPCNATTLPCDPRQQVPEVIKVERGKRYRIRVINTSAMAKFFFSIPGHTLNVIETDGIDTVMVPLERVPIAAAQRYSFLVDMDGPRNEYWIKAEADLGMYAFDEPNINPTPENLIPVVQAKLQYCPSFGFPLFCNPFLGKPVAPVPAPYVQFDEEFPEEMLLQPYDKILAPSTFDQEIVLDVEQVVDVAGVNHLAFNSIIYEVGSVPVLGLVMRDKPIPASANSYTTAHNQVAQIVINNHDTGPHPFHLHGHAFYVLGVGATSAGDYNSTSGQLVLNGVKRDTIVVPTESWVVLRFVTDNPGAWFLHCHIHWHLESGLAAVIIEAPEVARQTLTIPAQSQKICSNIGVEL